MKTPDSRFYCPLITVGTIILDENESSHAVRVCRAANGDTLQLCDGLGHYADATITKADAKACEVRVDTVENAPFKRPRLKLAIACLKDDALEEVVFHVAQTETDSIVFLRTDYSQEPKNSDLHKLVRRSELKSLVSLKQSKKAWMTRIEGPIEFDKWLNDYQGDLILCDIDGERNLKLDERAAENAKNEMRTDNSPTDNAQADNAQAGNAQAGNAQAKPITLLVGPEGGFSPREINAVKSFENGKVHLLNLGNTRLRARTAAVVALGKIL